MRLHLRRTVLTDKSTVGELSINGIFECHTLEDVVRPDGVKIYGETAIPAGNYTIDLNHSPRFKRVLPLLINVKGYIGVRIHPGNKAGDTEGCVLVGSYSPAKPDWISASRVAFDALFARLEAAHKSGEKITMVIE